MIENVKGLLSHDKENKKDKYGRTWSIIWNEIQGLEEFGYDVKWKVMNTRDYGIPQNRERIFIVGLKGTDFKWPEKIELDDSHDYIDFQDISINNQPNYAIELIKRSTSIIINLGFTQRNHNNTILCPCITTSSSKLWNNLMSRYCNINELFKLQGFQSFKNVVSDSQLKKQIGNSMSVNVVKIILNKLL